jgi:hypothetical protein
MQAGPLSADGLYSLCQYLKSINTSRFMAACFTNSSIILDETPLFLTKRLKHPLATLLMHAVISSGCGKWLTDVFARNASRTMPYLFFLLLSFHTTRRIFKCARMQCCLDLGSYSLYPYILRSLRHLCHLFISTWEVVQYRYLFFGISQRFGLNISYRRMFTCQLDSVKKPVKDRNSSSVA